MKMIKMVSGVQPFFDSATADDDTFVVAQNGVGSVYTYIASGVAGQSATVEASANGTVWVHLITLTIDVGQTSETGTKQHVLPFLRVTGDARLQICRGAA